MCFISSFLRPNVVLVIDVIVYVAIRRWRFERISCRYRSSAVSSILFIFLLQQISSSKAVKSPHPSFQIDRFFSAADFFAALMAAFAAFNSLSACSSSFSPSRLFGPLPIALGNPPFATLSSAARGDRSCSIPRFSLDAFSSLPPRRFLWLVAFDGIFHLFVFFASSGARAQVTVASDDFVLREPVVEA